MTAVFGRRQRVINDKLGHRRRLKYGLSARLSQIAHRAVNGRAPSRRFPCYSFRKRGEHRDQSAVLIVAIREAADSHLSGTFAGRLSARTFLKD